MLKQRLKELKQIAKRISLAINLEKNQIHGKFNNK